MSRSQSAKICVSRVAGGGKRPAGGVRIEGARVTRARCSFNIDMPNWLAPGGVRDQDQRAPRCRAARTKRAKGRIKLDEILLIRNLTRNV